jgi:hypothetical protein
VKAYVNWQSLNAKTSAILLPLLTLATLGGVTQKLYVSHLAEASKEGNIAFAISLTFAHMNFANENAP